jgi:FMN hydrolase / 5-amino-6-(5-phospho-D-ribitylamino)uracil phosphatase
MPRAILLDVMGTIVAEPFLEVVPSALGMSLEEILEAKHPTAWVEFEKGLIDEDTLRARFFADGRSYDHEKMKSAMVEDYRYLDGMESLLADLSSAGHALHLMSNYPSWYRLIEDKLRLSRYAAWTFVSCHVGLRKPDEAAYHWVAETVEAPASELLFVDDRERNCAAARAVGMDAIRFTDAAALREALRVRSILS